MEEVFYKLKFNRRFFTDEEMEILQELGCKFEMTSYGFLLINDPVLSVTDIKTIIEMQETYGDLIFSEDEITLANY